MLKNAVVFYLLRGCGSVFNKLGFWRFCLPASWFNSLVPAELFIMCDSENTYESYVYWKQFIGVYWKHLWTNPSASQYSQSETEELHVFPLQHSLFSLTHVATPKKCLWLTIYKTHKCTLHEMLRTPSAFLLKNTPHGDMLSKWA